MTKKQVIINIVLLCVAALIAVVPLVIVKNSEFAGADGKAEKAVVEIAGEFEPHAVPIWEPPGSETESLLFALQAALGSGVIFYCIGYLRGKHVAGKS